MELSNELLQRAVALKVAADAEAGPRAAVLLSSLHAGKGAETPQSASEAPNCWPFTSLPKESALRLLWACEALPGKAPEFIALWK